LGELIKDSGNAIFYNFTYPITINQSKLFAWNVHVQEVANKDESGKQIKCPGHHNSVGLFKHGDFQTHNFFKYVSLCPYNAFSKVMLIKLSCVEMNLCGFALPIHQFDPGMFYFT